MMLKYNKITSDVLNAKIKQNQLVNKSDISNFVKDFEVNTEIGTLAAKVELKAE